MCKPVITDTICGIARASFAVKPTPAEIAGLFCDLDDEHQAEFFVAVKVIADTWRETGGSPNMQWEMVGGHLAECPGATAIDATQIIELIHEGIEYRRARPR